MDIYGRVIFQSKITDGYRSLVDLSTLEKGIYFIHVENGTVATVQKLMIE